MRTSFTVVSILAHSPVLPLGVTPRKAFRSLESALASCSLRSWSLWLCEMTTMSGESGLTAYSVIACGSNTTLVPAVVVNWNIEWPYQRSSTGFFGWATAGAARAARATADRRSRVMVRAFRTGGQVMIRGRPGADQLTQLTASRRPGGLIVRGEYSDGAWKNHVAYVR